MEDAHRRLQKSSVNNNTSSSCSNPIEIANNISVETAARSYSRNDKEDSKSASEEAEKSSGGIE